MRLAPLYEQKPHPRLKWFSLGAGYDPEYTRLDSEIAAAIFVPFLKGCSPALKVDGVNLSYSWEFFHPAVNDALATLTGTRPRYFEIPSGEYDQQQDEALASTLLNLWVRQRQDLNPPQEVWTSIQVKGCPTSSPRAFRAIIEACQHGLENLLIYLGQRITSQEIQTILHTSTSLRRLSFFHIPRPLFDYRAMLQSSWNCTRTLTQLDIHITNIPRPDVLFDWRGDKIPPERKTPNHTGAIQESRAFQRDVYTRLASLVNLETLELGTSCPQLSMVEIFFPDGQKGSFDRNQQLCCLEMTLDSGLEILSTLKNLRILLVESMEHRIGIRELKWFERAWPNLLYLGGIVSQTKRTSILYGLDIPDLETCDLGYGLH
ncbi:hypothetical protein BGW39_011824 [Mortierella sp. 14UC]|nr:hypothetical protein BGW39_011824 [Mortierella sp. 14UC]